MIEEGSIDWGQCSGSVDYCSFLWCWHSMKQWCVLASLLTYLPADDLESVREWPHSLGPCILVEI